MVVCCIKLEWFNILMGWIIDMIIEKRVEISNFFICFVLFLFFPVCFRKGLLTYHVGTITNVVKWYKNYYVGSWICETNHNFWIIFFPCFKIVQVQVKLNEYIIGYRKHELVKELYAYTDYWMSGMLIWAFRHDFATI